jgi:enterobactin synthetase component F
MQAARSRPALSTPHRAPVTELERRLAEMWSEVLMVRCVGADGDFFELGGNSLLGMRITDRIMQTIGVRITPRRFYGAPTVADLALVVAELSE